MKKASLGVPMKIRILFLILLYGAQGVGATPVRISPVIEKELLSLQARLAETRSLEDRLQEIQKTLVEIRDYQRAYPATSLAEQGRVSLLMAVLEFLPEAENFKKQNCNIYRNDYLNQFEPMADDLPEDPSVLYGWDTLNRLCI